MPVLVNFPFTYNPEPDSDHSPDPKSNPKPKPNPNSNFNTGYKATTFDYKPLPYNTKPLNLIPTLSANFDVVWLLITKVSVVLEKISLEQEEVFPHPKSRIALFSSIFL